MITKLAKFATFAVLAAFTTLGCARQDRSAPIAPMTPPVVVRVAPALPKVASKEWSLNAIGWKLVDEAPMEDDEPVIVARYTKTVGENVDVIAQVVASKLDKKSAATFYDDMKEAANGRDSKKVKVIGQRVAKHGEHDGYEVLELRKLDGGIAVVLSCAITDGKVGYLVVCGGDAANSKDVLETCKSLIGSFRVSK